MAPFKHIKVAKLKQAIQKLQSGKKIQISR